MAVGTSYRLLPEALAIYHADARWWLKHPAARSAACLKYGLHPTLPFVAPEVTRLEWTGQHGLETQPWALRTGGHSGYQAINLAFHLMGGQGRILLLGYDMQPSPTGQHHFCPDLPCTKHLPYDRWVHVYATLRAALASHGVPLINCTRETSIPNVPRQGLLDALRLPPSPTLSTGRPRRSGRGPSPSAAAASPPTTAT